MSAKSDMVANPVLRISKAKIVSLKKGKTYVENVDDWERSLKNTLSASALEFFLEPESGIQVPDDQADSVWLQELCNQQVFANRTSLAKQEKVNGQVHIKEEPMTPLTSSKLSEGPMTPKPPETEPSGRSFERKDTTSSSGNRLSKYEENVSDCLDIRSEGWGSRSLTQDILLNWKVTADHAKTLSVKYRLGRYLTLKHKTYM